MNSLPKTSSRILLCFQDWKSRQYPNNPNFFEDLRHDLWNVMDWGFGSHKKRVFETLRCSLYRFGIIFHTPDYKNSNISKHILILETLAVAQIQDYGDLTARKSLPLLYRSLPWSSPFIYLSDHDDQELHIFLILMSTEPASLSGQQIL